MAYNFYEPEDMFSSEPDFAVQPASRSSYAPQTSGANYGMLPLYRPMSSEPSALISQPQYADLTYSRGMYNNPENYLQQARQASFAARGELTPDLEDLTAESFNYSPEAQAYLDKTDQYLSTMQGGPYEVSPYGYSTTDRQTGIARPLTNDELLALAAKPDFENQFAATFQNPTGTDAWDIGRIMVRPDQDVRVIDRNTGDVVASGSGYEGGALAAKAAADMFSDKGKMANFVVQGAAPGEEWSTISSHDPERSGLGNFVSVALPLALMPLTMGASAPLAGLGAAGNIALGAGVGGITSAARGQNILSGALTGGLTAAGTQFLGPLIQSVPGNAAVATNLGRSIGAGIGATAGGVLAGQPLDKALMGGAITGGTTYLGGELFGGREPASQSSDAIKNYGDLAYGNTQAATRGLSENLAGLTQSAASQLSAMGLPTSSFSAFTPSVASPQVSAGPSDFVATARVPSVSAPSSSFSVNVPLGGSANLPETVITAKKTAEPTNLAVNVPYTGPTDIQVQALRDMFEAERQKALAANVPAQAMGGPDLEEEIIATAQDEGLRQAEGPSFAVNVPTTGDFLKNIDVNALRDAAALEEKGLTVSPYTGVSGPDLEKAIEVTAQKTEPAVKDEPSFAVNVPTTGDFLTDLEVNAPKKPPVDDTNELAVNLNFEDLLSDLGDIDFAGDDDIIVEGDREKVIDDEGAVGGPFIDAGDFLTDIEVNAPKKPAVDDTEELAVDLNFEDLLSDLTDFDLTGDDEIIVEGKDEDVVPDVGPLSIPTNIDAALKDITKPDLTPPEKKTIDDIIKYLRLAGLGIGLVGNIGGGGGGSGSGRYYSGRGSLNPIFSAQLPGAGTGFTVGGLGGGAGGFGGGTRLPTDWYRYAMGPAMDIPAGVDMRRATSPYAGYGPGTLGEETFRRVTGMSHGGPMGYSRGSSRESFAVEGPGTGRSDDIPAVLSDGEYVIDAETVALLGDGSSKAGAKKLDEMRVKIRKHKGKNLAKGKFSVNAKHPEKYMSGGRI